MWPAVQTVALDLETTGLNRDRDRIIQYGMFGCQSLRQVVSHTALVDAETPTGREPRNIPGVSAHEVSHARPLKEHLDLLYQTLHGSVVIMHNAAHDWAFVLSEFKRHGRRSPEPVACICTYSWARRAQLTGSLTLGDLCVRFNIPLRTAHHAWHDARATFYLYATWLNTPEIFKFMPYVRVPIWQVCSVYFPPQPQLLLWHEAPAWFAEPAQVQTSACDAPVSLDLSRFAYRRATIKT